MPASAAADAADGCALVLFPFSPVPQLHDAADGLGLMLLTGSPGSDPPKGTPVFLAQ